jgi:hypothetical protein
MKNDLKMKFEKEKEKKKQRWFPFQPRWPKRPIKPPRAGPLLLFSFSFSLAALTSGARLSASPPPFLSSSSRHPTEPAPPRDPRRARPPPHIPFLSPQPIKAIKPLVINWTVTSHP